MIEVTVSTRVQKSWLNARVNVLFYLVSLALSYFSRRIFLQSLGTAFVGFTGTVGNFLEFLNLAEMGTAMAVSFALYKPLATGDRTQIAEIVSLTGYLYRRIGNVMAVAGVVLSLFLPLIFPHPGFPMRVVFFAYYSFLISSLLSYYLNYSQVLLDADQRNYVVTAQMQTTAIIKICVQMVVLTRLNGNCYSWVLIELLAGIVQGLLLRRKVRKTYPFLHSSLRLGKAALWMHPGITRSIKQLSVHKISEFTLVSTKELFIYLFGSLTLVAYYGNYLIVLTRLNQLLLGALDSMQAGIGHLIAEGNIEKTLSVFWQVLALRYFVTGVFCFMVYHLLEPFISLWLGRQYLLDRAVLLIIMMNVFLVQTRDIVLNFVQGYGLFDDLWAPATEMVLNIGLSIILGYVYGMRGVLTGSVISLFAIAYVWKPYYLFRRGFRQPVWHYWRELSKYLIVLFLSWWIGGQMVRLFDWVNPYRNYSSWMIYSAVLLLGYSALLLGLLYPLRGMRCLVRRLGKNSISTL